MSASSHYVTTNAGDRIAIFIAASPLDRDGHSTRMVAAEETDHVDQLFPAA